MLAAFMSVELESARIVWAMFLGVCCVQRDRLVFQRLEAFASCTNAN